MTPWLTRWSLHVFDCNRAALQFRWYHQYCHIHSCATPAVYVAETCCCQGVSHTLIFHQCQPMNIEPAAFGLAVIHCIKRVIVFSAIALFSASSTWLYSRCCPALSCPSVLQYQWSQHPWCQCFTFNSDFLQNWLLPPHLLRTYFGSAWWMCTFSVTLHAWPAFENFEAV